MNDYVLITDSTADVSPELANELDVEVVPLNFSMGGKTYTEGEMSFKEFYTKIRKKVEVTTSQINPSKFIEVFSKHLEQGKDILYIAFSSSLSATYNSSKIAAQELADKYPDRKIIIIDSLCAAFGEGLLVYNLATKKKSGASIDELASWAEENKLKICHWFTVEDLYHLKRGGRVSGALAVVGSILGIKPIMHLNNEGKMDPVDKARGRPKAIDALIDQMRKAEVGFENAVVAISHGDCEEEVNKMAEAIKKEFKVQKVLIGNLDTVIGSHAGAGTIALFFMGTQR